MFDLGRQLTRLVAGGVAILLVVGGSRARAQQSAGGNPPPPLAISRIADPLSQGGIASPTPLAVGQPAPQSGQRPLPPLPVTRLEERPREDVLDAGRTFSLHLSEPVPVKDVLLLLVRDTRFSLVAAPGVEGTFVGDLNDVTLKQALDLVSRPLGLDYSVDDTLIRVFPRRMDTRRFDIDSLHTVRAVTRGLGTPGGLDNEPALGGATIRVTASDPANLFDEISAGVQTLLSPEGRFNLDRKAALLQVTDYPDRLDQVGLYVEAVQQRAARQVALQASVVEVELNEAFASGLDWRAILGESAAGVNVTRASIPSLLAALATQGAVRVLASPRVVAMNHEPAVMRVGRQDVYFVTSSRADPAGGAEREVSTTPRAATEGLVLSVTPQITADGFVQLSVMPSVTEREDDAVSRFGEPVPILSVREADTLVRLRDGETVVISGLMRPRRGRMTDLVVLLTPTIVGRDGGAVAVAGGESPGSADSHGRGPGAIR